MPGTSARRGPLIALAMGDPGGIGPELIVKLLSDPTIFDSSQPFVVGDRQILAGVADGIGVPLEFGAVERPGERRPSLAFIEVFEPDGLDTGAVRLGRVDPANGQVAALCLRAAFDLATSGRAAGVVTAPMNKEAFHLAGYDYPDELCFLGDVTGSREAFLVGVMGPLWTINVTDHVAFADIPGLITKNRVRRRVEQLHSALVRAKRADPRLGVAALNVHGGEGGLFGREEIDEIGPAIEMARAQGILVEGPIPADAIFVRALTGEFDGVVCMYHDQANIARKLQPRDVSATLYMGLPVAGGTTAHGTAFDRVGANLADPGSLRAALNAVVSLSSG
ncbi:MAG: 4-hydroxythreonine-4-phosphate dehydrogenase PdxA [Chloroflexi bacterium]|nr:4-hydroxythreonine-4-phosphate dehydrogenase PdxA [Chloroflexota bacterium]